MNLEQIQNAIGIFYPAIAFNRVILRSVRVTIARIVRVVLILFFIQPPNF